MINFNTPRKYIKLTSDCFNFKFEYDEKNKIVTLIWEQFFDLQYVCNVGMSEILFSSISKVNNSAISVACNLLKRTVFNRNKEIVCGKIKSDTLYVTKNLTTFPCDIESTNCVKLTMKNIALNDETIDFLSVTLILEYGAKE